MMEDGSGKRHKENQYWAVEGRIKRQKEMEENYRTSPGPTALAVLLHRYILRPISQKSSLSGSASVRHTSISSRRKQKEEKKKAQRKFDLRLSRKETQKSRTGRNKAKVTKKKNKKIIDLYVDETVDNEKPPLQDSDDDDFEDDGSNPEYTLCNSKFSEANRGEKSAKRLKCF